MSDQFPNTIRALDLAINEVKARAIEEAERRGKVATGGTLNSLATQVVGTDQGGVAYLTGEEQWKFVGNGRGPGGMPPIARIEEWIRVKGLDLNPYAVARTMATFGSLDHRRGAPNIFMSAMDDFEQGAGLERLEEAGATELENVAADAVAQQLKRSWQTSR